MLSGFNSGLLEILWNTSGFTLRVDPKRKEVIPELKEKEFIDYAFSIIRMVADLAEGKSTEDALEKDLETASEIYARENDLKNHLYVKRNSKINCFKHFESQIISYRNEENPKEIAVNSAIVRVMTEMEDEEIPYTFELSRRDLGNLIDNLIELKEKWILYRRIEGVKMAEFFVKNSEISFPEIRQYTYKRKNEYQSGLNEKTDI